MLGCEGVTQCFQWQIDGLRASQEPGPRVDLPFCCISVYRQINVRAAAPPYLLPRERRSFLAAAPGRSSFTLSVVVTRTRQRPTPRASVLEYS